MNLSRILYFVSVADTENFSVAARRLNVAQPALSARIKSLEAELDAPLFVRHSHGVSLTEAGKVFLPHARHILASLQGGRDAVAALKPRRSISIGSTQTLGLLLVPRIVAAFGNRPGRPDLLLSQGTGAELIADLQQGRLDAAFCYYIDDTTGLELFDLFVHDVHLVGPAAGTSSLGDGPVPFKSLAGLPLVLDPLSRISRTKIDEAARTAGVSLQPVVEVEATNAKAALMTHQGCYALVPRPLFQAQIDTGLFKTWRVIDPSISMQAKLVVRKGAVAGLQDLIGTIDVIRLALLASTEPVY